MTKYSCATLVPSSCVPFTGKDLVFLTLEEQPECDANLDEVIDLIAIAIKDLETATDVSTHNKACLEISGILTLPKLLQAHTDKLCALDAQLITLTDQLDDLVIGNELVTIDLGCLATAAAPCLVASNTYTLIAILNTFRSEICAIKAELGI